MSEHDPRRNPEETRAFQIVLWLITAVALYFWYN